MATEIDNASMQVFRAAWLKDTSRGRATKEVSMAKLVATEVAGSVLDKAVQIFGGAGVTIGSTVERLYREVRPMRIYEGASEVQKLVIARDLLKSRS
jgi:acyl-CoA dehydrogenase